MEKSYLKEIKGLYEPETFSKFIEKFVEYHLTYRDYTYANGISKPSISIWSLPSFVLTVKYSANYRSSFQVLKNGLKAEVNSGNGMVSLTVYGGEEGLSKFEEILLDEERKFAKDALIKTWRKWRKNT